MTAERYQKIKKIFHEASDLALGERTEFLRRRCDDPEMLGEVEKMLSLADDETAADDALEKNAFELFGGAAQGKIPEEIGDYKIIREIGRGGMGAVYEAVRETENFKRRAALKIIKRGMDTDAILSRFRHEQQILSSLEHPFIAHFLDGGMTREGLPFYAMEFVQGTDIDRYCRENNLSIEERVKLFRQVCAAVQYAHQNFIAHRDLKPNNILVTRDGTPKLLDFGIAKVLSGGAADKTGTATELGMMTPAYASPEQIKGEKVGVQSDIYSLGVILYELLTGCKPYHLKTNRADEAIKAICESEPVRPSSAVSGKLSASAGQAKNGDQRTSENGQKSNPRSKIQNPKSLKGDLDNIILKALKKEPERRYASVEQFSEDLRRHLEGLPVKARPDTVGYRASKFIRRNKASVVTGAIVFLALIGGILGTTYQARIAQGERERAEKRFAQVRKLANSVVFKYHDAIANLPGATATREMLVKDATEYLDNLSEDAQDNPELTFELAQAYLKIGNVQGEAYRANLGDSAGALESYRKSEALLEDLIAKDARNAEYLKNLNEVYKSKTALLVRLRDWQEAEATARKLLALSERQIALEPENQEYRTNLARSFQIMGDAVEFSGGHEATIDWFRRSMQEAEKNLAKNPADENARRVYTVATQRLGTRLEYYADLLLEKGESAERVKPLYTEAEALHRRSIETAESLRRDFPNNEIYLRYIAAIDINWGTALARIGRGDEGVPRLLRSLATFRETVRQDPKNSEAKRDVAECLQYLAYAYDAMGKYAEAVKTNRESLVILEEITANDPSNFEFLRQAHLTYNNTGDILLKEGKSSEALDFYQKGIEYVEKMSRLNPSSQIIVLESESNRKIGAALLALAEKNKSAELTEKIRFHLAKARAGLERLKAQGELGKNYEHRPALIEKDLERAAAL